MARTIIETSPGRFKDPETNKRTSRKDGDQVVNKDEWEKASSGVTAKAKPAAKAADKPKEKVDYGKLSTGKQAHGPTVEITCKKRGCGNKRVIMKQDQFQVKFCLEHQKEERNRLRRERRKAKAASSK